MCGSFVAKAGEVVFVHPVERSSRGQRLHPVDSTRVEGWKTETPLFLPETTVLENSLERDVSVRLICSR